MLDTNRPKSVVVGIDGSQAAIRAARWAVDEVAGTETPLTLLYCGRPNSNTNAGTGRDLSGAAQEAIRNAVDAVRASGKAINLKTESVDDLPITALIEASESARLLCIGRTESGSICGSGFGSTAAYLVESAGCPVAVVRGEHHAELPDRRSVVTLVDGSPDDEAALDWGFEESLRRNVPLVLLTAYRTEFDLLQEDHVLREHDRRMRSVLDRYVSVRGPRYPAVELHIVTAFGTFLRYLTEHAKGTQLAVVSAQKTSEICQLVGAGRAVASSDSDFSLLVVR
jgi:nucleotide-binding universal stress UspA family protein